MKKQYKKYQSARFINEKLKTKSRMFSALASFEVEYSQKQDNLTRLISIFKACQAMYTQSYYYYCFHFFHFLIKLQIFFHIPTICKFVRDLAPQIAKLHIYIFKYLYIGRYGVNICHLFQQMPKGSTLEKEFSSLFRNYNHAAKFEGTFEK